MIGKAQFEKVYRVKCGGRQACELLRNDRVEEDKHCYRGFARRSTPRSMVSFLYCAVWRKTTKHSVIWDLLNSRIYDFNRVCVLMFLPLGCSLVLRYELNKKFWDIWLYFPIPDCGERKPTWRSLTR